MSSLKSKNSDHEVSAVVEEILPRDASDKIARAEQTPSINDTTNQFEYQPRERVVLAD